MNRRQFLAACGAAALLPSAAAQAAAAQAAVTPRPAAARALKKAASLDMVQIEGSIADKFALLRELGFDGVELNSPTDLDRNAVLAALRSSGLAVSEVVDSRHWSAPLSDPDPAVRAAGRAALETALADAAHWGAGSVLLVPAVVSKTVGYHTAWEHSTAEIRKLLPRAAELQVAIAIENVWNGFLLSPLEAARYVDEFESPWVGWHFDVGNVINLGWPEQWIEILGPRTRRLHIKEYSRSKRDAQGLWKGFDVELLEGDNDWPAVMAALDKVGYTGWATLEVPGGDRARLADLAARLDRIVSA